MSPNGFEMLADEGAKSQEITHLNMKLTAPQPVLLVIQLTTCCFADLLDPSRACKSGSWMLANT